MCNVNLCCKKISKILNYRAVISIELPFLCNSAFEIKNIIIIIDIVVIWFFYTQSSQKLNSEAIADPATYLNLTSSRLTSPHLTSPNLT